MKRLFKIILLTLLGLMLLAGLMLPVWLLGSTSGARFLFASVSKHTPVSISASRIEGRLAGDFFLERFTLAWPQGKIHIGKLAWSAKSLHWITGRIDFEKISLSDVAIEDHAPDTPPTLSWPQVPVWTKLLDVKIDRLEATNFSYRKRQEDPVTLASLSVWASWHNRRLSVNDIRITSEAGVVYGQLLAGFGRPLLEMDLRIAPSQPLGSMDGFHLQGKFGPGKNRRELSGSARIATLRQKETLWQLTLETGLTARGMPLTAISLTRPKSQGEIIGQGFLALDGEKPHLTLAAKVNDVALADWLGVDASLSGTLNFTGNADRYSGKYSLGASGGGWKKLSLAGDYSGDAQDLILNILQGEALGGNLRGHALVGWQNGLSVSGELSGSKLDPGLIDHRWQGEINFDLKGKAAVLDAQPLTGEITVALGSSRLHGRALSGDLRATFAQDDIRIAKLALQGKGFSMTASGRVQEKIVYAARISDLSLLIPDAKGSIDAAGWLSFRKGSLAGSLSATGRNLALDDLDVAKVNIQANLDHGDESALTLEAKLGKLRYQSLLVDAATLSARGTKAAHTLDLSVQSGAASAKASVSGTYASDGWQGKILRLSGSDGAGPWRLIDPVVLTLTKQYLTIDNLTIAGQDTERIHLSGKADFDQGRGAWEISWDDLNLSRINVWGDRNLLTGLSGGKLRAKLLPGARLELTANGYVHGTRQFEGQSVIIQRAEVAIVANEQGTKANLKIHPAPGGHLEASFTSKAPASLSWPEEGNYRLSWGELDLSPYSVWLPRQASIEGLLAGEAYGKLLPNGRFSMKGLMMLAKSRVSWQGDRGDVRVNLRNALFDWTWQDDAIQGALTLSLAKYGRVEGKYTLPVSASFPVSIGRDKAVQATLSGRIRESGALSVIFPDLVHESLGHLDFDLNLTGSLDKPAFSGKAELSEAGGYLPSAGITLKDAKLSARLEGEVIHVDAFSAASGPGRIEGTAQIQLSGWQVKSYEGSLSGSQFQLIYFPELQVQANPKLTFSGGPDKLSVRGEVVLPEVQIVGAQSQGALKASPDVVVAGRERSPEKQLPIDLDVDVRLIAGDAVTFKAGGIDARVDGHIQVRFQELDAIYGQGEIRVAKGRFRTYGVNLDIERGRLIFAGGPIDDPTLDILAWRKIGEIRAGVVVSGTLKAPLLKLYSEPTMQDMDILAYIVLGHPLGSNNQQASLLVMAAGALLTSRQSENIQRQIKDRFGFEAFDISADVITQDSHMGYKRLSVAPGGDGSSPGAPETILVVGKYLTPKLYISYGRSLFSGSNLFFLRYNLSKHWQIESQTGQESGADIYYKLEFN